MGQLVPDGAPVRLGAHQVRIDQALDGRVGQPLRLLVGAQNLDADSRLGDQSPLNPVPDMALLDRRRRRRRLDLGGIVAGQGLIHVAHFFEERQLDALGLPGQVTEQLMADNLQLHRLDV